MKNKNANTLMLLTGIVAGASTVLFLKSEKGQKLVDIALSKGEAIKTAATDNAQQLLEDGKQAFGQIVETGNSKLNNAVAEVKDTAESKIDTFQKGVDKAKAKLENTTV